MNLADKIEDVFRLKHWQKAALHKLHLETLHNLLFHFPARYQELGTITRIDNLSHGERATVYGAIKKIESRKTFKTRIPATEATITDGSGTLRAIWFHQPYLAKMFAEGTPVKITGKATAAKPSFAQGSGEAKPASAQGYGKVKRGFSMANPEIEPAAASDLFSIVNGSAAHTVGEDAPSQFPVYPESFGITSRWFYYALQKIFKAGIPDTLEDLLPSDLRERYHLPSLKTALRCIHLPRNAAESAAARKRFAFEEVFYIQLGKQQERRATETRASIRIERRDAALQIENFLARLTFEPTRAQRRAIDAILNDFEKPHAMSRLLEGDVGSGKTAVAAATAYAVVTTRPYRPASANSYGWAKPASMQHSSEVKPASALSYGEVKQDFGTLQVVYMAPTEILAKQHFATFIELFSHLPINMGLLTSGGCKKFPSKVNAAESTSISRAQLLKWAANGEIAILIGTHALIQKSVTFKHLAYVIIDEQHRFGVRQRMTLARGAYETIPHLLSMTATPIPRTLALTIYGDLDLTLLDEMPEGRKAVITETVAQKDRGAAYEKMREELKSGRQAYVICPRIEEPDPEKELALQAKSVIEEAARLKRDIFPEYEIAVVHGKLKPKERDDIMERFTAGEIHILAATSVIEVGVNVPNATVIIIEGAERFGLAQLHQLRGRVLRSTHQSYCFLFTDSRGEKTRARLKAITTAKNGFELAEMDLKIRGPGELTGRQQWGISDVGMEALKNIKMVEAARTEATALIANDTNLSNYPLLAEKVTALKERLHFE